jgi:hypothetical protein
LYRGSHFERRHDVAATVDQLAAGVLLLGAILDWHVRSGAAILPPLMII